MRDYKNALAFADQVRAFYPDVEAIHENDYFSVVLTHAGVKYQLSNSWRDYITVALYPYPHYKNVDNHRQNEIRKALDNTQNMRVLSKNKLAAKLALVDAIHAECMKVETAATEKHAQYLKDVEKLAKLDGVKVSYNHHSEFRDDANGAYKRVNTDISGGEITRAGIRMSFTLDNNGYISQRLTLDYGMDHNLETFEALSQNVTAITNRDKETCAAIRAIMRSKGIAKARAVVYEGNEEAEAIGMAMFTNTRQAKNEIRARIDNAA